jgi:hypothetical protein
MTTSTKYPNTPLPPRLTAKVLRWAAECLAKAELEVQDTCDTCGSGLHIVVDSDAAERLADLAAEQEGRAEFLAMRRRGAL